MTLLSPEGALLESMLLNPFCSKSTKPVSLVDTCAAGVLWVTEDFIEVVVMTLEAIEVMVVVSLEDDLLVAIGAVVPVVMVAVDSIVTDSMTIAAVVTGANGAAVVVPVVIEDGEECTII